jgi:hypothetical protein
LLLRHDEHGVLAIGQASHAWLSGQLARAWGNEQFGVVEPHEEVCLAADQHDVGMAAWDLEPSFNQETGLPHSFMEMPLEVHTHLWLEGPRRLVSQSAYAALLVSMHGWRLYKRRDLDRSPPSEAQQIRKFLAAQEEFQDQMAARLGGHPGLTPALKERNSLLIWTWDYLSLALCLDWAPATAKQAPLREGSVDLTLRPTGSGHRQPTGSPPRLGAGSGHTPRSWTLEPWPFQTGTVLVRCEGRRLPARFRNASEMRRGLSSAPAEALELVLERRA